jgi:Bax protein
MKTLNVIMQFQTAILSGRRLLLLCLLSVILSGAFAQSKFVKKFSPLADSLSDKYGIPACVILGVSILESGSGTSRNSKRLNNYFGIVGKNKLDAAQGQKSRYKQYPNATASFIDFCHLLKKRKYYKKLKDNMNYVLWVDAISKNGYSEIPEIWKERVIAAIRKNKLSATDYY